jgi:nitrilase
LKFHQIFYLFFEYILVANGQQEQKMEKSNKSKVKVAVTQAEPVWLDLDATVEKTCLLINEASKNGAEIIAFPECWIPGYPAWVW